MSPRAEPRSTARASVARRAGDRGASSKSAVAVEGPDRLPAAALASPGWAGLPMELTRFTGVLLHWAHARAGRAYAAAMAPLGLRAPQVPILQWLAARGATAQARLGEYLDIDKATMVALLNGLEAQGLVERRRHPIDRRAFDVHLTTAGRARLAAAERATSAMEASFFAALSLGERRTLHTLLRQLVATDGPETVVDREDDTATRDAPVPKARRWR